MGETSLDLELVVSEARELTVPASALARLAAVPGQRVRVRVDAQAPKRRAVLGALAKPGLARLTVDDFDDIADDVWGRTGYGNR